ncbi:hypothetical protein CHGG_08068 [Chaetomium globosum CBS 148.51]|uniref:Clr5 domain-containing protein n=1 Tax=Chaetomium globosum (strain ATCC 6205 / CBS 148.51 / DSM 1962 / NBRC 6347 / NRRL 1970) TaxID=306901 RepID=Q2GVD6_CHAGB|nr:uncharacterized protein CHGG_08068 [Chaetomium globosum CBS 148.51]EAQ86815.1 hypothetical protein CHGG_08068 [Chaetomium globosum CBS 148.51]
MDINDLLPHSRGAKFLDVPYEERWECLRPIIVRLYMGKYGPNGKSTTMAQVVVFMRDNYLFHASPYCECGRGRETVEHLVVWCPDPPLQRPWDGREIRSHRDLQAVLRGAYRILLRSENQYRHRFSKCHGYYGRVPRPDEGTRGKRSQPIIKNGSQTNQQRNEGNGYRSQDPVWNERNDHRSSRSQQKGPEVGTGPTEAHTLTPTRFSSWNLPYAAYSKALGKKNDQPSPFGETGSTPSYLNIESLEAATPGREAAGPSPTMQLVRQKVALDRSSLFLQGRHLELLASCGKEDRTTLANYLHDFYIHSFVVAKYWGRGPRMGDWTAGLVSVFTLGSVDISSSASFASAISPAAAPDKLDRLDDPTQLCRWSIHVRSMRYNAIPEEPVSAQDGFDIQDPRSWVEWPLDEEARSVSFVESMGQSITNSTFSLMAPNNLPISTESLSQSVQQNPELLRVDAWKVAIMAGNVDLLWRLYNKTEGPPGGINEIYPFHLAASFLDGGNKCCGMISSLSSLLGSDYLFFNDRDDLDHTVLDSFMITILRSHTSVGPEHVSARFNPPHRFPGEEKDICGRWDADSPAVRALFRHGYARVPTKWKHAFCHTAAQAICHSVIAIWGSPASPPIDALSGLFVRRCNNCGLELKLGPLHTLVVVTFYLAHLGMPGETMFGALTAMVCLLSLGAHASLETVISVEDILGRAEPGRCCHKLMDAYDLMCAVPHDLVAHWSTDCQTGWMCILQVLLLARQDGDGDLQQDADSGQESDGDEFERSSNADLEDNFHGAPQTRRCWLGSEGLSAHAEWLKLPCGNPKLGLLWATIQVELLTYRRIDTADSWLSTRFSMSALKTWLEGASFGFHIPLVEGRMVRKHSPCGWFHCHDFVCPVAEEVCKEHFMNMDVYDRAPFLERPNLIERWIN